MYTPKKGEFISLGGIFFGVCENVFRSEDGEIVVICNLVKNAFQRGASELHHLTPELDMRPATKGEIGREIALHQRVLRKRLHGMMEIYRDANKNN